MRDFSNVDRLWPEESLLAGRNRVVALIASCYPAFIAIGPGNRERGQSLRRLAVDLK